jgi:DNA invertase Pin-like site-specific DNA recombinase
MTHPKLRTAIYARVSTLDQDPAMQLRELRAYAAHRRLPITAEFIDQVSGTTADRLALERLWQAVRARKLDTILVWKFDRFARSTKQLIDALEEFRHLGVDFISITEQIDTSSPMGKAMFTVISAIAEFERSLISERVRAGIAKARATGQRHGRPKLDAGSSRRFSSSGAPARACTRSPRSWAPPIRPSRIMDHHGRPGSSHDEAGPRRHAPRRRPLAAGMHRARIIHWESKGRLRGYCSSTSRRRQGKRRMEAVPD